MNEIELLQQLLESIDECSDSERGPTGPDIRRAVERLIAIKQGEPALSVVE